jgi:hypothetical protein
MPNSGLPMLLYRNYVVGRSRSRWAREHPIYPWVCSGSAPNCRPGFFLALVAAAFRPRSFASAVEFAAAGGQLGCADNYRSGNGLPESAAFS